MLWDAEQDQDLVAYYHDLIALRKAHPALQTGQRQVLHASANLLAYRRATPTDSLVIVLNTSSETARLVLPISEVQPGHATSMFAQIERTSGGISITLPGFGGIVLG
jgi:glycosidase